MTTKPPPLGASEFRRFVILVQEHHTMPDMPLNGNMGVFSEVATLLAEELATHGYTGFEKALIAAQKADINVNIALSTAEAKPEDDPRLVAGKAGKMLRTLSIEDVLALPNIQYLVAKILQVATVSLLFGESGTGKTFIALSLAFAIAYGQYWLGRKVIKGRVLYIYAEGKLGLKPRLKALLKYYGLEPSTFLRFIAVPLHLIQDRQVLFNTIADQGADCNLVVVDTFSNCASGVNHNDQEEVYPVLAVAHEITQIYGAHVLVVHHTNRQGGYAGSAAFKRHVDTMLLVEQKEDEQGITLINKKQRDEELFPDINLRLEQVTVETDPETLESITSCVVINDQAQTYAETRKEEKARAEKNEQRKMVNVLAVHKRLNTVNWIKECRAAGVSKEIFYAHIPSLLEQNLIVPTKDGRSVFYEVAAKDNSDHSNDDPEQSE